MCELDWAGLGPLRSVLAIGAHSDDLEIGCGASILTLTRAWPGLTVHWLVLAADGTRADEAKSSARAFLEEAHHAVVEVLPFRDGFLPFAGCDVKNAFESLKSRVDPQLVLTHTREDLHQDHRFACELTWNTFRDHLILEYEIPKWDGDLGRPNLYVPVEERLVAKKLRLLEEHFGSQRSKDWFDGAVFRGLMRLRGMECRSPSGYAEAFYARKLGVRISR
jgi:LmbE family N-acetylglucosaminyl deacetylase